MMPRNHVLPVQFRPLTEGRHLVVAILAGLLSVPASAMAIQPLAGGGFRIFTDASESTPGLVGSYVNTNLAAVTSHDDWRTTQPISGSRIDAAIDFQHTNWGSRGPVGITGGTDADWEYFSVQWDGYVRIDNDGVRLATESDDSSRMWIDLDGDDVFEAIAPEYVNNHWGTPQAPTLGELSVPIPAGLYRIRLQYEEQYFGTWMRLTSLVPSTVRFAYLIPANRSAAPGAELRFEETVLLMHEWYAEQMERLGLGRLSFRYETRSDGRTPLIHTVNLAENDVYFHPDIWGRVHSSASAAGVPLWSPGEIWIVIPEIHIEAADGSVTGGAALGAGGGSAGDAGVAMVGSAALALAGTAGILDDRTYSGLTIPTIGPYPLAQDLSFPWFEGTTISGVVSSFTGAMAHEMGHALGLAHDWRNDGNFHGNVMFNGLRGIRGALFPQAYGADDCRLEYASALSMARSSYFTSVPEPFGFPAAPSRALESSTIADRLTSRTGPAGTDRPIDADPSWPDVLGCQWITPVASAGHSEDVPVEISSARPTVSITSAGSIAPGGAMVVSFSASDDNGLALALLRWDGNTVEEMPISGTSIATQFHTTYYNPGVTGQYQLVVYDIDGNTAGHFQDVIPASALNRAPQPYVRLQRSRPPAGQAVLLDAGPSTDPDAPASQLSAQWDLDDDGTFDTAPSSNLTYLLSGLPVGHRRVRVRLTDAVGGSTTSTALGIRVDVVQSGVDEADPAGSPLAVVAGPNPFRDSVVFRVTSPSYDPSFRIEILDPSGRLVRRLTGTPAAPGAKLVWDGRSESGRSVPSGVYFYRAIQGRAAAIGRIQLVR